MILETETDKNRNSHFSKPKILAFFEIRILNKKFASQKVYKIFKNHRNVTLRYITLSKNRLLLFVGLGPEL